MVRLRLTRLGAKKRPFYRIVAADSRAPRDGRYIEQLGYYDPMKDPIDLQVDLERVDYWLGTGAQASDTVGTLLARARTAADTDTAASAEVS
ncbi:MAG TPA: 30S ribosomal protein S16 [Myxococcota bacterium]|nr:30S ribosomal protein S16 [Myxococcota bacterium]